MSTPFSPSYILNFSCDEINFDEILYQDMAIRRFCPERIDQEPEWNSNVFDIETWSSSFDDSSSSTIDVDSSFIDSIINASPCEEEEEEEEEEEAAADTDSYSEVLMGNIQEPDPASIDKGLELIHLLLACAEAVGCRDAALAASTLSRIWPMVNPNGDSLQRVSFYFATGLKSRLSLLQNVGPSGFLYNVASITKENNSLVTKNEKMDAFHLLHQATPYISFGFMAANEAILHASKGKGYLHIIDLGMSHTLQWPHLIQKLASRPEGLPIINITGIASPDAIISDLESNMQFLIKESSAIGVQVNFHLINEPSSPSLLTSETLKLKEGETLFFNSIAHLHRYAKESRGSLKAMLIAIKKLKPELFTVVEQDANHNGPFFLARFLESLHYYSALFDSLEASLLRPSLQRRKIEKYYLGEEIRNIVACEGGDRVERHEKADQWRRQLGRAGYQAVSLDHSICEAKALVSGYGCDGYTIGSEKGCLLLGWRGRTIMWASAWQVNSTTN